MLSIAALSIAVLSITALSIEGTNSCNKCRTYTRMLIVNCFNYYNNYCVIVCLPSGKMIRPMVTFVVTYCVCVWSAVCFSCIEADPLPYQRQMNTNGTSGIYTVCQLSYLEVCVIQMYPAFTGC